MANSIQKFKKTYIFESGICATFEKIISFSQILIRLVIFSNQMQTMYAVVLLTKHFLEENLHG